MPNNYVANIVGRPFTRVRELRISYSKPNTAEVQCVEHRAALLDNGDLAYLGDQGILPINILPSDMARSVQLVHPETGLPIPGATMTIQSIMLGILAVVREAQHERDIALDNEAP